MSFPFYINFVQYADQDENLGPDHHKLMQLPHSYYNRTYHDKRWLYVVNIQVFKFINVTLKQNRKQPLKQNHRKCRIFLHKILLEQRS